MVREGTDSKDFDKKNQVGLKMIDQFCFIVYYGNEFRLKTLSVAGAWCTLIKCVDFVLLSNLYINRPYSFIHTHFSHNSHHTPHPFTNTFLRPYTSHPKTSFHMSTHSTHSSEP